MLSEILQPTHLMVILLVVLLVLGPKRLPGAGRALGQGLSEFKRSISGTGGGDAHPPADRTGSYDEASPPHESLGESWSESAEASHDTVSNETTKEVP